MADQEQSIGRKIMSIFFVPEDTTQTASAPIKSSGNSTASSPAPIAIEPQMVKNNAGTGVMDKKFVDHFVELLEKSNLQGPDYFEYMTALKSLAGLGLSEDKQFQAAWASFKAMGGMQDVAILTNTASQYLTILNTDRESFLKSVEGAVSEKVGGLQKEQKQLQADNEVFAKQILELQTKINANNERLAKINGEVSEQSTKINQNKNNYEITYNAFIDQIKGDVSKINQYLK